MAGRIAPATCAFVDPETCVHLVSGWPRRPGGSITVRAVRHFIAWSAHVLAAQCASVAAHNWRESRSSRQLIALRAARRRRRRRRPRPCVLYTLRRQRAVVRPGRGDAKKPRLRLATHRIGTVCQPRHRGRKGRSADTGAPPARSPRREPAPANAEPEGCERRDRAGRVTGRSCPEPTDRSTQTAPLELDNRRSNDYGARNGRGASPSGEAQPANHRSPGIESQERTLRSPDAWKRGYRDQRLGTARV